MPRLLRISTALLVGALAVGCTDQQPPTTPTIGSSATVLRVERSTFPVGFIAADGRLILFIGLSIQDVTSFVCTGTPFNVDEANQLIVTRPNGSSKQLFKGQVNVVVLELDAFAGFFCEDPSAVPTYTGTARVIGNDSDVDLSGSGADASMLHVVGTVTDQSGQQYHLLFVGHALVGREFTSPDNFVFRHTVTKIRLTALGR